MSFENQSTSPPKRTRASARQPDDKGWWIGGFLFGFTIGLILSLTYGWVLDPRPLPVRPADLAPRDKEVYLRLIAAAYAHDHDETKAKARLAGLNEPDIEQRVVDLTENYIIEERDVRDITALIALAETLGQTSSVMLPFIATPTPQPTSTSTPAPTPTPRPTNTPTPSTPTRTITPTPAPTTTPTPTLPPSATPSPTASPSSTPTRTPTPGPDAPYGVAQSVPLCDNTNGGLLRIYVRDRLEVGVPGVEISVTWPGGKDKFFTGFKPEIDPGYADFQLKPNELYRIEPTNLKLAGPAPEVNINSETLCPDLPVGVEPSWQLVFEQGVSR